MNKIDNPKEYKKNVKVFHPKPNYFMNCLKAFVVGGGICVLGEGLEKFFMTYFNFNEKTAGNPTVATLILIASLLTGFGVYDSIGKFAGAGSLIPVTGFANSVTSAALEHKSEGVVFGIATNLFKLAGAVIVFGVVSSVVFGVIRLTIDRLLG